MAVVPFSGLSGQTAAGTIGVPSDYDTTQASPDAFGAAQGRAESALGGALQQAGGTGLDVATREEVFQNRAAVTDALDKAQQAAMNVQYGTGQPGDPNAGGFYAKQGKAAVDAYAGSRQQVMDAFQQAGQGLTPAQQALFQRESRRTQMATLASMARHQAQQGEAYAKDAQQSAVTNNIKSAVMGYTSDAQFQAGLANALDAQSHLDAMQGLPPETMQANAAKVTSEAWAQRALRSGADNAQTGLSMVHANLDKIDPVTATRLIDTLTPRANTAQGNAIGMAAIGGGAGHGGAGGPPPQDLDQTVDRIIGNESGGNPTAQNPRSTAGGAGQFINSTWLTMAKLALPDAAGKSDQQVLAMRNDPTAARAVTKVYAQQNSAQLQQAGFAATPTNIYLAHGFGAGGAIQLLNADPSSQMSSVVTPAVMQANPQYAGKTVGQVRQSFANKMGDTGPQTASAGSGISPDGAPVGQPVDQSHNVYAPDRSALLRKVDDLADQQGASPEARDHAYAAVDRYVSRQNALGATERQSIDKSFPDTLAALGQGLDGDVDTMRQRINAAGFPQAQAEDMQNRLTIEQQAGQVMKGLEFAPLDQAVQTVQQLQVPGSVQSGRLVLRRGQVTGQGANQTQAPASENPADMRLRLQVAQRAQSLLQQRQTALAADPVAYAQRSPDVQQAWNSVQQNPNDPRAMQSYAAATIGLQKQLGVPDDQTRLLTNGQAASLVSTLTKQDPSQGDTGAQLDRMSQQYGSYWPQVFGEMVNKGKLPRDYQVLANMDQPYQTVGRQDFQRALTFMATKGGPKEMMNDLPQGAQQELRQNVDGVMDDFRQTTQSNTGGLQLYNDVRDSVMHLAAYRMATGAATDSGRALQTAYQDIVAAKYDFDGTMRVPKGQLSDARAATQEAQQGVKPDDLAQIAQGSTPGLTPQDTQAAYARSVQRQGFWVPNKDDSGVALMIPVRNSTTPQAVMRSDGTPFELKFSDMKYSGKKVASAADTTAAAGTVANALNTQ